MPASSPIFLDFTSAASVTWASPAQALTVNAVGSTIGYVASQSANKLRVFVPFGFMVPSGATIVGFQVEIIHRILEAGYILGPGQALDIFLTLNGTDPVGQPLQVNYEDNTWRDVILGDAAWLFRLTSAPLPSDVNNSNFGLLIVANSGNVYDYTTIPPGLGGTMGGVSMERSVQGVDFVFDAVPLAENEAGDAEVLGYVAPTLAIMGTDSAGVVTTTPSTAPVTRAVDYVQLGVYYVNGGGATTNMIRETGKQVCRLGMEATPNSPVATTTQVRSFKMEPQPNFDTKKWNPQGEKTTSNVLLIKEDYTGNITGIPTYNELGYLFSSWFGKPNSVGGTPNAKNVHSFRYWNRSRADKRTFTLEYGDANIATRCSNVNVKTLDLKVQETGFDLSGTFFGNAATDTPETAGLSAGNNEIQAFTVTSTGSYTLSFLGLPTSTLTDTSTTAAIQTALRALASLPGATQVVVAGTPTSYTVTFSGAGVAGQAWPAIVPAVVSGTPVVAVTRTTKGGMIVNDLVPIVPKHCEVYMATTYAGLSTGKLTRAFMTGISLPDALDEVWTLNRTVRGFDGTAEAEDIAPMLSFMCESSAANMAWLAQFRSDTAVYFRMVFTGPQIGAGPDVHMLTIEGSAKISAPKQYGSNQNIYAYEYELTFTEDLARAETLTVVLQNGMTGYAA